MGLDKREELPDIPGMSRLKEKKWLNFFRALSDEREEFTLITEDPMLARVLP